MRTNPGDAGSGGAADNGPVAPGVTGSDAADAAAASSVVSGVVSGGSDTTAKSAAGTDDTGILGDDTDHGTAADGAMASAGESNVVKREM